MISWSPSTCSDRGPMKDFYKPNWKDRPFLFNKLWRYFVDRLVWRLAVFSSLSDWGRLHEYPNLIIDQSDVTMLPHHHYCHSIGLSSGHCQQEKCKYQDSHSVVKLEVTSQFLPGSNFGRRLLAWQVRDDSWTVTPGYFSQVRGARL